MLLRLFQLELRLLARERAAWVLLGLFAVTLAGGLWNGARLAKRQQAVTAELTQTSEQFMSQVRQAVAQQAVDPRAVAQGGQLAALPPAPLPWLAIGQSDLSPGHQTLSLWKLQGPADTHAELENPSVLLTGRLDLAFALVWLFPLFLLALTYDLLAGDREAGTLRLACAQGVAPGRWLAIRALTRALPVLALAGLATLVVGAGGAGESFSRLILALAFVLAYGLFWVALAAAVNVAARTAAGSAAALGAAWVVLVLVAPTLLNVAVETLHPTPSRPELVAAARRASGDAEKRGGDVLQSFYRDHPELAPPGQQADLAAQLLAVQTEVGRAIEPVQRRFHDQLARQQATVGRWRLASPAIAAYETLTDLAGTGYWRNRAFREQVEEFKGTVSGFFGPKIHRRESLTQADVERLPRFNFREEPAAAWRGRVGLSLAGVLAATALLGGWVWLRLRPSPLGRLAAS